MIQAETVPILVSAGSGTSGMPAIPYSSLRAGKTAAVGKVPGTEEVGKSLAGPGLIRCAAVRTVSDNSTGSIPGVKGSRVAVEQKTASKFHVADGC